MFNVEIIDSFNNKKKGLIWIAVKIVEHVYIKHHSTELTIEDIKTLCEKRKKLEEKIPEAVHILVVVTNKTIRNNLNINICDILDDKTYIITNTNTSFGISPTFSEILNIYK